MKTPTSRYAILGMLSIAPMSGYDIKQVVEQSIAHFWTESYGRIYPVLRELEREKLARKKIERAPGKPDRQVYSLTAAGKRELSRWLGEPAGPDPKRNELLLKLFFSRHLEPEKRLAHVAAAKARRVELLEVLEATEASLKAQPSKHPDLPYWLITLSYGKHTARAVIEWADETMRTMKKIG